MPAEPFGPWEWNDAKRCPATTLVRDDRMGGWVNRCMKAKGHRGHHRHVLSGCDPIAYMSWIGTHSDGGQADG